MIQHDTHEALISTEDAEAILARLEKGRPARYAMPAEYLLSGLLVTPSGRAWHGNGDGHYRHGKGKRVRQDNLEQAIVAQVARDLMSDSFVAELEREGRDLSIEFVRKTHLFGKPEMMDRYCEGLRKAGVAEEV